MLTDFLHLSVAEIQLLHSDRHFGNCVLHITTGQAYAYAKHHNWSQAYAYAKHHNWSQAYAYAKHHNRIVALQQN